MSIALEWVGLACFRLWRDGRPDLVMDPYRPTVLGIGEDEPQLEAETVIASSLTDTAHSYVPLVKGKPRVIDAWELSQGGKASIHGEPVATVGAAEAPEHPEGADPNAIYGFRYGDLQILHLGDLGYGLDADQLTPFVGKCDVLMALTGEKLTLKLPELDPMLDVLQPTWIFPMHYKLLPIDFGMTGVEAFIRRRPRDAVYHPRHHTVTLPLPKSETGRPTIVVLEPSGYRTTCK